MALQRCTWPDMADPLYQQYHDQEWGRLNLDENYLFEMMLLEAFQAGLSWRTILHKRANFREAFAGFYPEKIAKFDDDDFGRLMQDRGIIRNRLKIKAAINNAKVVSEMHKNGNTLAAFLSQYVPDPIVNEPKTMVDLSAKTELSAEIARAMKKAGFKFMGPVIVYSYLEAVGLVNDHMVNCDFK
jgi:DNA-3-methyladenine glycosylase I